MSQPSSVIRPSIELLQEKGYLDTNFKTPTQMGYWIREFEEQFNQCREEAHLSGSLARFSIDLSGKFNDHLDTIHFTFRYSYNPDAEALRLTSLHARLYQFSRPFYFGAPGDLPSAQEVYDRLAKAVALKNNEPMYKELQKQFDRDRNVDNDYAPPDPKDKSRARKFDIQDPPPFRLKIRR